MSVSKNETHFSKAKQLQILFSKGLFQITKKAHRSTIVLKYPLQWFHKQSRKKVFEISSLLSLKGSLLCSLYGISACTRIHVQIHQLFLTTTSQCIFS